jgi:hypothetical protein
MNEELGQLDADLKGLFVENKIEEIQQILGEQPDATVKEMYDYNWNIIKKYYDNGKFELLLSHLVFVAYTCFITEYAYKAGMLGEEVFQDRMTVYGDIYEKKRKQSQEDGDIDKTTV